MEAFGLGPFDRLQPQSGLADAGLPLHHEGRGRSNNCGQEFGNGRSMRLTADHPGWHGFMLTPGNPPVHVSAIRYVDPPLSSIALSTLSLPRPVKLFTTSPTPFLTALVAVGQIRSPVVGPHVGRPPATAGNLPAQRPDGPWVQEEFTRANRCR